MDNSIEGFKERLANLPERVKEAKQKLEEKERMEMHSQPTPIDKRTARSLRKFSDNEILFEAVRRKLI